MKKVAALVLLLACPCRDALALPALVPPGGGQGRSNTFDGECAVPDLIGLSRSAAEGRLGQAELRPRVELRPADQPVGTVIDQRPKACAPRPRDGQVSLLVSTGPATRETRPRRDGPSAGEIAVPVGIAVGAAVIGAILANRGEKGEQEDTTTVPDVVKMPEGAVEATLRKSRLRRGETTRQPSMNAAAGTVITQFPAAGTRVPPESAVNVQVSAGRPTTEVPDLAGLDWDGANARTTEARVRIIATDPAAGDFSGLTVSSQVPAAGTRVAVGAAVGVTLRAAALTPAQPAPVALQPAPPQLAQAPTTPPAQPQVPPPQLVPQPPPPRPAVPNAAPARAPAPPVSQPALVDPPAPPPVAEPPLLNPPAPPPPQAAGPAVPPVTPNGQGDVPVTPDPPSTPATNWLWLLLVLAGMALVIGRIRRRAAPEGRSSPPPMPGIMPRITCVPRLDTGSQAMAEITRGSSRTVSLVGHLDAGIQHLQFGGDPAQVLAQIGGHS